MYKKLLKLAKKKGVSLYRLSKDTGINQTSFHDWKVGRCKPSLANLMKLADYFKVDIKYFIE